MSGGRAPLLHFPFSRHCLYLVWHTVSSACTRQPRGWGNVSMAWSVTGGGAPLPWDIEASRGDLWEPSCGLHAWNKYIKNTAKLSVIHAGPTSQRVQLPSLFNFPACPASKLVLLLNWSNFQAGPASKLVQLPSWSNFQAGPTSKLVQLPSWSNFQAGPTSKLDHLPSWSNFQAGLTSKLVQLPSWSNFQAGLTSKLV